MEYPIFLHNPWRKLDVVCVQNSILFLSNNTNILKYPIIKLSVTYIVFSVHDQARVWMKIIELVFLINFQKEGCTQIDYVTLIFWLSNLTCNMELSINDLYLTILFTCVTYLRTFFKINFDDSFLFIWKLVLPMLSHLNLMKTDRLYLSGNRENMGAKRFVRFRGICHHVSVAFSRDFPCPIMEWRLYSFETLNPIKDRWNTLRRCSKLWRVFS